MKLLNKKGPKIEPWGTHAASSDSGSPQEAHRQTSQHHKHGWSFAISKLWGK